MQRAPLFPIHPQNVKMSQSPLHTTKMCEGSCCHVEGWPNGSCWVKAPQEQKGKSPTRKSHPGALRYRTLSPEIKERGMDIGPVKKQSLPRLVSKKGGSQNNLTAAGNKLARRQPGINRILSGRKGISPVEQASSCMKEQP